MASFGLRDAVVRGDDEDNDVGNFRSTRAHASEGFVAGRVTKTTARSLT